MVGDTIAAIATPPGKGGVGIVRISGPKVPSITKGLLNNTLPKARFAHYASFKDAQGQIIDQGIALYFPAPHSFTGESILELQGHGGPVVLDLLMQRVFQLGARSARPGEFSERAFLNNKLDLTQAEAIADLIASETVAAARASQRSLQGQFSRQIYALVEDLIQLRIFVEATLDFPEEELGSDVDFFAEGNVGTRIVNLQKRIETLQGTAKQGSLLRDGMRVVIVGPPNAGKSTLMNALAGRSCAIVSESPGTTRDVLTDRIDLDGMPLHIIDTAGLRKSNDFIEQEGIKRAWQEIYQADRILLLVDVNIGFPTDFSQQLENLPKNIAVSLLLNKMDLVDHSTESWTSTLKFSWLVDRIEKKIELSAKTGVGLDLLRAHLKACMGFGASTEGVWIARRRHREALQKASGALLRCAEQIQAGELVAEELRGAQDALGEITGKVSSDELLGRIFSSFCIGK